MSGRKDNFPSRALCSSPRTDLSGREGGGGPAGVRLLRPLRPSGHRASAGRPAERLARHPRALPGRVARGGSRCSRAAPHGGPCRSVPRRVSGGPDAQPPLDAEGCVCLGDTHAGHRKPAAAKSVTCYRKAGPSVGGERCLTCRNVEYSWAPPAGHRQHLYGRVAAASWCFPGRWPCRRSGGAVVGVVLGERPGRNGARRGC